ncbi:MAG: 6-phosphogluconolactonase [bacterium]
MSGNLVVLPTPDALVEHVASWLTERARSSSGAFRLVLSGGHTPAPLYARLASSPWRDRFPWHRTDFYWGDERCVSADDPESNSGMARRQLLAHVPVAPDHVHPIPGEMAPPGAAAAYEQTLRDVYGAPALDPARPLFDVTLLGLGEDGHTASLFPGTEALAERARWVTTVRPEGKTPRVTLTYPALESSRCVAFLVSGESKASILRRVRGGASDAPAARLRPVGEVVWFVDRAAAGEGERS